MTINWKSEEYKIEDIFINGKTIKTVLFTPSHPDDSFKWVGKTYYTNPIIKGIFWIVSKFSPLSLEELLYRGDLLEDGAMSDTRLIDTAYYYFDKESHVVYTKAKVTIQYTTSANDYDNFRFDTDEEAKQFMNTIITKTNEGTNCTGRS